MALSHRWDLVAYDVDGARYCLDCCAAKGIDTEEDKPESGYGGQVMRRDLDESGGEYCSMCFEILGV